MKGQYTLVNEILVFILGIFIAVLAVTSLGSIEDSINSVSTMDTLTAISDYVSAGIANAYENGENSTIILRMPVDISAKACRVRIVDGNLVVSLPEDERINVTHEIFNISAVKNINGEFMSNSPYVTVIHNATSIEIRSW